ncbi:MAG: hypothetical protein QNJ55_26250 [Xenococcus sp. MO_188.B8]|nr:hypothetical protein [Xenococcus sp. MO_188.B8]
MQLIYCVQAYSTSNNQIETHNPRFLGQDYNSRRPVTTVNSQLGARKNRGEVDSSYSNSLNKHYGLDECCLWLKFS